MAEDKFPGWHGTTILAVRRGGEVVVAGDGQVSLGQTVIKGSARKVRRLSPGGRDVVCGFAGSTADAFTLLERLEKKLEAAPGQLTAKLDKKAVYERHGLKLLEIGPDDLARLDEVLPRALLKHGLAVY